MHLKNFEQIRCALKLKQIELLNLNPSFKTIFS